MNGKKRKKGNSLTQTPTTNDDEKVECPYCNLLFKNQAGVNIHIGSRHKEVQPNSIVQRHTSQGQGNGNLDETNHDEPNDAIDSQINFSSSINEFLEQFEKMLSQKPQQSEFDEAVESFAEFLRGVIDIIPGPKHPATKFYKLRKDSNLYRQADRRYTQTTNPVSKSKRDQKRKKENFTFDLIQ